MQSRPSVHRVLVALVALALAIRFWFVCDDAYITFRFARNWAYGRGLVFNPGEFPPVEGYSDFLWMVLAALCERVSAPPDLVLPAVSAACAVLLAVRVHDVAHARLGLGAVPSLLGALAFAASPAAGVWATSGLETMPQALLVFLLFERLVLGKDERDWAIPALLGMGLALIRTEGLGWVGVVAFASVIARWADRRPLRPHAERLARALAPVLLLYAMYTAWRFQYYGTLVPNTALVKVAFGGRLILRGVKYLLLFWATCLVPLLALLPAAVLLRRGERVGSWLAITLLAVAFPAYAVVVGGDFMPFGRLLVPGLPFGALLLAGGLQELMRRQGLQATWSAGVALVLLGLLPGFDLHLVPELLRRPLHFRLSDKEYLSEYNRWDNQKDNTEGFTRRGLALAQVAQPGDAVVAAAVGAIGYFSDLRVLDQHGLVTKEVAYQDLPPGPLTQSPGHDKHVEPEFFAKYEPRFLFARAVWGKLAAGLMKDTLEGWEVDEAVMDRYVPDWYEIGLPGIDHRAFLLVVRRKEPGEDPAKLWNEFAGRRRALNSELRATYAEEPDLAAPGDG